MKKLAMFLGALALMVVFSASQTGAALLGIKAYSGFVPDILYDSGGQVQYDADQDLFTLIGWDQTLYLEKPGPGISLGGNVGMGIAIKVDEDANLIGGVSGYTYIWKATSDTDTVITDYDMIEYVLEDFSFTWKGTIYSFSAGDTLLAAEIRAFGWDETNRKTFDFLFEPVSGKLVDYGLWPSPYPLTGAYVDLDSKFPSPKWTSDWGPIGTDKGDKVPTPEPSSLLLLGSGLLGFGAYFRARFGRKKKD